MLNQIVQSLAVDAQMPKSVSRHFHKFLISQFDCNQISDITMISALMTVFWGNQILQYRTYW